MLATHLDSLLTRFSHLYDSLIRVRVGNDKNYELIKLGTWHITTNIYTLANSWHRDASCAFR